MAAHGAFRLMRMIDNLSVIQGVEAMCSAQGIEVRAPLKTSAALQSVVDRLRLDVETLTDDRYLAPDIQAASNLVRNGAFCEVISHD